MIKKYRNRLMRAIINLPRYVYNRNKVIVFRAAPYGSEIVNARVQIDLLEFTNYNTCLKLKPPFLSSEMESILRKRITWNSRVNDICYLVSEQGRVVGYGWVKLSGKIKVDEIGISIDLDISQVCLYDFYIDSKVRNRGIYRQFLQFLRKKYESSSCLIYAESSNISSCSGILAAGFLPCLAISGFSVFSWRLPSMITIGDKIESLGFSKTTEIKCF